MSGERPKKVLIVDDEPSIRQLLERVLGTESYVVYTAYDGSDALRRFCQVQPDVVLLDVKMPGMDGWEVCRQIRAVSGVPIVMITVLRGEADIVRGLDAGADDYITKPFRPAEVLARIRAVLRRASTAASVGAGRGRIECDHGRLVIDLDGRCVWVNGRAISLSATEFKLLIYLAANSGRVLTQRQILEHVWGPEYIDAQDYVKVYIHSLRQKIEEDPGRPRYLIAHRGLGYRFRGEAAP